MLEDLAKTLTYVGRIQSQRSDLQHLPLSDWRAFYEKDARLEHAPPRIGRNPANGQQIAFKQPIDQRAVRRDERWIAWFSWAAATDDSRDSGFLEVYVADDLEGEMLILANEVANGLDAQLSRDL